MTDGGTTRSRRTRWILAAVAALVVIAGFALWPAVFFALPPSVTGEGERLAKMLQIRPGMMVAEIGAGKGDLTVEIARRLGRGGRMYSTELDPARLEDIREAVEAAGLTNTTILAAKTDETNLPPACCQAIFMRTVYHHITEPAPFNKSVRQSLADGGLFAIIDFEPGSFLHLLRRPDGTPAERGGHGVPRDQLMSEVSAASFEVAQIEEKWGGNLYLVLFRAKPPSP